MNDSDKDVEKIFVHLVIPPRDPIRRSSGGSYLVEPQDSISHFNCLKMRVLLHQGDKLLKWFIGFIWFEFIFWSLKAATLMSHQVRITDLKVQ